MATDNSPPRIRIILTIAFSSFVVLVALGYVFRSYFIMMTEQTEHDHLMQPVELEKLHAGEQKNLTSSPLPIQQAMQELASKGRTNYAAFAGQADITPQASDDVGPLVGWVQNPNQAFLAKLANAPADAPDAGAASAAASAMSDAGAPASGANAGGVKPGALSDGGAGPKTQLKPAPGPSPPSPAH
jgi:hypothetical protein